MTDEQGIELGQEATADLPSGEADEAAGPVEAPGPEARGRSKTRTGRVVSGKMDNTVIVAVERIVRHRRYKKYMRVTKKLVAHDAKNQCSRGDTVRVVETRPLSKTKRWRVAEVLRRAQ